METKFSVNTTDDFVEDKVFCTESLQTAIFSYLICVAVGSLSILIMCGNLLVITSIIYFKQLHTPTNYLILSLAVADLLVGVLVLPFSTMLSVSSCWHLKDLLCTLRGCFDMILCAASILNLCCISVDRYYLVCQPLTYRTKMNIRVTAIMILMSWTVSALFGIYFTIQGMKQPLSNNRCKLFQTSNLTVIGIVCSFYLPAIIVIMLYLKILTVAQRQARSIHNTTKSVNKMEGKATKTLVVVIGVFLMCWAPFFLCISVYPLCTYPIPVPVIETFKWLGWSNSMLNPFVYAFFYSWFRSAFRMIISGKIFHGDFSHSKLN